MSLDDEIRAAERSGDEAKAERLKTRLLPDDQGYKWRTNCGPGLGCEMCQGTGWVFKCGQCIYEFYNRETLRQHMGEKGHFYGGLVVNDDVLDERCRIAYEMGSLLDGLSNTTDHHVMRNLVEDFRVSLLSRRNGNIFS